MKIGDTVRTTWGQEGTVIDRVEQEHGVGVLVELDDGDEWCFESECQVVS